MVGKYFLSGLYIHHPANSWPPWFLRRNELLIVFKDHLYVTSCFSVSGFTIFSLSLCLLVFITKCLSMGSLNLSYWEFFEIFERVYLCLLRFEKFSAIISSNIVYVLFFLSFWNSYKLMVACLMRLHKSPRVCSLVLILKKKFAFSD